MTKTNKKGRELLDNVNADHDKRMWERREMQLGDFKAGAQEFIGQIKGQSTGQQEWSRGDFQQKKQSRVAAKLKEAKRVEKRQRGSNTLKKRKSEVPEYLKKLEDLKKYKKGFKILLDYYGLSRCHPSTRLKLEKLGLV